MEFQGYKITYDYSNWQQAEQIGDFWDFVAQFVPKEKIVGLGWNWNGESTSFDYALGAIDDPETLDKLKSINFKDSAFHPTIVNVELPPKTAWETFSGKVDNLQKIYETEIDPLGRVNFELEYIDSLGNLKILINYA